MSLSNEKRCVPTLHSKIALFVLGQSIDFYVCYALFPLAYMTSSPAQSASDVSPAQASALWTALSVLLLYLLDFNKDAAYDTCNAVIADALAIKDAQYKNNSGQNTNSSFPQTLHSKEDEDADADTFTRANGANANEHSKENTLQVSVSPVHPEKKCSTRALVLPPSAYPDPGVKLTNTTENESIEMHAKDKEEFESIKSGILNAVTELGIRCITLLLFAAIGDARNLNAYMFLPAGLAALACFVCTLPPLLFHLCFCCHLCDSKRRKRNCTHYRRVRLMLYACGFGAFKLSMACAMLPALAHVLSTPACMLKTAFDDASGALAGSTTGAASAAGACLVSAGPATAGLMGRAGILFPVLWLGYLLLSVFTTVLYVAFLCF